MKRKRGPKAGNKKGKQKGNLLVSILAPENDTNSEEDNHVKPKTDSASLTTAIDKNTDAELPSNSCNLKPMLGRVRVRLKSSKPLEVQHSHSDLQSESDTSQSKSNIPGHKLYMENKDDSGYSDGFTSDLLTTSTKSPRKSGSIKIISSKGLDKYLNKQASSGRVQGERVFVLSDNEKVDSHAPGRVHKCDMGSPCQESCYNKNDLNDALMVIRKVMKMDAAEPFNAPVDPVALGIPDYFDVIDNPMDFGTICKNLELGKKYLSSDDIFKDVQLIWDNCNKYNNKGDYIIDLMKRVKKNFMKYWVAAGLSCEVPVLGVTEGTNGEENKQFHQEIFYTKVKMSKYKRKRLGTNHHKSGCMCAVCVVRRQKKEREGNAVPSSLIAAVDANTILEPNDEEGFPIDNQDSDHSSMSLSQSPVNHFSVDAEEQQHGDTDEPELHHAILEGRQLGRVDLVENEMKHCNVPGLTALQTLVDGEMADLDFNISNEYELDPHGKSGVSDENHLTEKEQKQPESLGQIGLYEDPMREENHLIMHICGTVFSSEGRSVWNGPHSLTHRGGVSSIGVGPFFAAMSTFLERGLSSQKL